MNETNETSKYVNHHCFKDYVHNDFSETTLSIYFGHSVAMKMYALSEWFCCLIVCFIDNTYQ